MFAIYNELPRESRCLEIGKCYMFLTNDITRLTNEFDNEFNMYHRDNDHRSTIMYLAGKYSEIKLKNTIRKILIQNQDLIRSIDVDTTKLCVETFILVARYINLGSDFYKQVSKYCEEFNRTFILITSKDILKDYYETDIRFENIYTVMYDMFSTEINNFKSDKVIIRNDKR